MESTLKAERRDGTGKGAARKLRATGRVPAILYGQGEEPTLLSVSGQDLRHLLHGGSTLLGLEFDGTTHLVIPREIQRDHLHARYIHVDFLTVRRDEKMRLSVEVREIGDAPGVKAGGVLEHHLREVEVECLPGNIPEGLDVDVSELEIGDSVKVGDIALPSGVEILTDADVTLISVVVPAALRTEADLSVPGEEGEEVAAEEGAEVPAEAPADEGGEG